MSSVVYTSSTAKPTRSRRARAYAAPEAWHVSCTPGSSTSKSPLRGYPLVHLHDTTNSPFNAPRHARELPPRLRNTLKDQIDQLAIFEDRDKQLVRAFVRRHPEHAVALLNALQNPICYQPSLDALTGQWGQFPNDTVPMESVLALHLFATFNATDGRGSVSEPRKYMQRREEGRKLREYVLTPNEMALNGFVIPSYLVSRVSCGDEGLDPYCQTPTVTYEWMETAKAKEDASVNCKSALAIDCEMVKCGEEQILAQICVVDYFMCQILYFRYVTPPPGSIITDYVTEKSGITPAILDGPTSSFHEVQRDVLRLIRDSNTILVGHGLHTDLKVLKLAHPKVVDTSMIFDPLVSGGGCWWQRPKLRDLVNVHLGMTDFQNGQHSPAEDAFVCVELVKRKIAKGDDFGGQGYRAWRAKQETMKLQPGFWTPPLPAAPLWASSTFQNAPECLFVPTPSGSKAIQIRAPPTSTEIEGSIIADVFFGDAVTTPSKMFDMLSSATLADYDSDMDLGSGSDGGEDDNNTPPFSPSHSPPPSPDPARCQDEDLADMTLCDDDENDTDVEEEGDLDQISSTAGATRSFICNPASYLGCGIQRTLSITVCG